MEETIFVCGSNSWWTWLKWFHARADQRSRAYVVEFIESDSKKSLRENVIQVRDYLNNHRDKSIVFFSSQESLVRDYLACAGSRRYNNQLIVQSKNAVKMSLNKMLLKRWLGESNIATPEWLAIRDKEDFLSGMKHLGEDCLVKTCDEHWGRGVGSARVEDIDCIVSTTKKDNKYLERFVSGEEYSVVVMGWQSVQLPLDVVYKGPTSKALIHASLKNRICPAPIGELEKNALVESALTIAKKLSNAGFMEIEYIDTNSESYVIEINPRVCGTLRMSSRTSGLNPFNVFGRILDGRPDPGDCARPDIQAIEMPVPENIDPTYLADIRNDENAFVTTRITLFGKSFHELIRKKSVLLANNIEQQNNSITVSNWSFPDGH